MLRIAICDDLITEVETLKSHIKRYAQENDLRVDIDASNEAQDILATLEHAAEYDILFLDIYMEQLNGMDLARQLRRQGDRSRIIFFSTSKDHALDAFGVYASQYLVKPVSYDHFNDAMNMVLGQRIEKEVAISISSGSEIVKISLEKFIYAEAQQHYQHIHLAGGGVEKARMTCTELYELLEHKSNFVRLGASFIITLEYVARVSARDIELTEGRSVPVPRGSYAALKQKYFDYYTAGGAAQC